MVTPGDQTALKNIAQTYSSSGSLYIYGSAAFDIHAARDIDLVCFPPTVAKPSVIQVAGGDGLHDKVVNFYTIPCDMFLEDVRSLAYGGYYAHKFLFAFMRLTSDRALCNAPNVFWSHEYARLRKEAPDHCDAQRLVRWVHAQAFQYRPTVGRSLWKYLQEAPAHGRLIEFVSKCIEQPEPVALRVSELSVNQPGALYRFWREYNKYKCGTDCWGARSLEKISGSICTAAELSAINAYLDGGKV